MKKTFRLIFLAVGMLTVSVPASAAIAEKEPIEKPVQTQKRQNKNPFIRAHSQVLCVDGLKIFQTIGPAWGNGAAPAVSMVQLYEEIDGKVVPAKCTK